MNVRRFLGLSLFTYLMCAALAVGGVDSNEQPTTTVRSTIALQDLTPQQQAERVEALTEPSTTVSQPSTTVAPVPYETNCQEWFPTAISVGWPNDTETLKKLGRLLWKETRCLNVSYTHPQFNGHDHGIAQINEIHRSYVEQVFNMPMEESMSDPTLNLRFAYLLYSDIADKGGCGWRPWKLC
jgi:hypothetical protein